MKQSYIFSTMPSQSPSKERKLEERFIDQSHGCACEMETVEAATTSGVLREVYGKFSVSSLLLLLCCLCFSFGYYLSGSKVQQVSGLVYSTCICSLHLIGPKYISNAYGKTYMLYAHCEYKVRCLLIRESILLGLTAITNIRSHSHQSVMWLIV